MEGIQCPPFPAEKFSRNSACEQCMISPVVVWGPPTFWWPTCVAMVKTEKCSWWVKSGWKFQEMAFTWMVWLAEEIASWKYWTARIFQSGHYFAAVGPTWFRLCAMIWYNSHVKDIWVVSEWVSEWVGNWLWTVDADVGLSRGKILVGNGFTRQCHTRRMWVTMLFPVYNSNQIFYFQSGFGSWLDHPIEMDVPQG